MSYRLDYFVGNLLCPICGVVSPANDSTNMYTYVRDQAELASLGVGHPLIIEPADMEGANYLTIQLPKTEEKIRILGTWECPNCGAPFNWAEVVVQDQVIKSVTSVKLDRKVLEQAHFISDACLYLVMDLTDRPYQDLIGSDLVQILRDELQ
ncbi:hypothetical protein [Anthocerotibacter panamensis]|uniref:hypothetical protein n=1 Tax=Anthocerotibacter panamensis TaxID=2857077 RepID=UPI001C405510|nr:hypothetical protein [Anthocerotibacter panamensis]